MFLDIKKNFWPLFIVFIIFLLNRCSSVVHVHLYNNHPISAKWLVCPKNVTSKCNGFRFILII